MKSTDLKVGDIISIKNDEDTTIYLRVVGARPQEVLARRCEKTSPYNFTDKSVFDVDVESFGDDLKKITWLAAGFFDNFKFLENVSN